MGKGFAKKKKQARQVQDQLMKMQEQMAVMEATGTAANGLVTITLNGQQEMKNITIKPECIDPDDIEGLQDLIKAAYKDATKKLQEQSPMPTSMPEMPFDMSGFGF